MAGLGDEAQLHDEELAMEFPNIAVLVLDLGYGHVFGPGDEGHAADGLAVPSHLVVRPIPIG